MLFTIVQSMDNWLIASNENVAVVHCKVFYQNSGVFFLLTFHEGGKGRTGVVIIAWLVYACIFADITSASKHFATMRSQIEKGVTQPSQLRFHNSCVVS